MYSKIKKAAITLCFFLGLSTTNYAATITTARAPKHLYQPTAKYMQNRLSCPLGRSKAMVQPYCHYHSAYVSIPLSQHKWPSQLAYPIVPSAKELYTDASSLGYPWVLLGTAHTQHAGRTHMHLKYKLGISAWIASVIITQLYLNRAAAETAQLPKDFLQQGLTHVKLPKDFSATNLTYANLTGQRFTDTNFEGTQLEGAILTNTTCDYQQCFADNVEANQLSYGKWYQENLPKDLKSIAEVYPRLYQDSHKAALLQIACGLAYLPYWEGTEFYIKVAYWSCKLLLLKKQLSSGLQKQLVCSLDSDLEYDARKYCWQTDYPQDQVEEEKEAPHDDFAQYLKTFQKGLKKYHCKSEYEWGYNWYKDNIERNLQGLQKTYPKLTSPKLRKEAVDIAFQLSKIYQNQHLLFLLRYLSLQNRLIRLKRSAVGVGNELHYNYYGPTVPRYL